MRTAFSLLLALGCAPAVPLAPPLAPPVVAPPAPEPAAPAPTWPDAEARLTRTNPVFPPGWVPPRLLIDAGHGAVGNPGNENWACVDEADVMRRYQDGVVARLLATGQIEAAGTRPDAALVAYPDRIARANAWATAMISLHSDIRAGRDLVVDAQGCRTNAGAAGFSVLWTDEGEDTALVAARRRWAEAIAARMIAAGFLPYDGSDYTGLYAGDPAHPGVFVDRHAEGKRIAILRHTTVPTVIVETHEAIDPRDAARWEEPATLDAFADALGAAAIDAQR